MTGSRTDSTAGGGVRLLGISSTLHDSAAAIVIDGEIVAAVEQERLSRIKHDASFPDLAADCCIRAAGLTPADIDAVTFHQKPVDLLNRHIATRVRSGPRGLAGLLTATPAVVRDHLSIGHRIARFFAQRDTSTPPVHYTEHHAAHAAAAFYPSPFDSAAIMTVDGVGEWATATLGTGHRNELRVQRELRFPDSIGLLYSAMTSYCGFRVNSGEGELMGLAPFGVPRFADSILGNLVELFDDGSIRLNQRYFSYIHGRRTISRRFGDLFGAPPRPMGAPPTRREADLAASIQSVLEEVLLRMAITLHEQSREPALCLAGGVALNCVANGRLLRDSPFEEIWVQPAAGDAGNAIGAALYTWHATLENPRTPVEPDGMGGAFLGPRFDSYRIRSWLDQVGIDHAHIDERDKLCSVVAERIAHGGIVGWFSGRMEFGPRALGHRSILADPRSSTVQQRINRLVKERAAFRPFAPAVLADRVDEWFDHKGSSPYMTVAVPVAQRRLIEAARTEDPDDLEAVVAQVRSQIPSVTHVDSSARIQTVDEPTNPEFHRLLRAFDELTGCPVLLNTSFNARDEPIVCTPEDAYATFRRTGLDLLVLEDCVIEGEPG